MYVYVCCIYTFALSVLKSPSRKNRATTASQKSCRSSQGAEGRHTIQSPQQTIQCPRTLYKDMKRLYKAQECYTKTKNIRQDLQILNKDLNY